VIGLERIEFLTDSSIIMRAIGKEAKAFVLLESLSLKVSLRMGHHRREYARVPRLVLNLLV